MNQAARRMNEDDFFRWAQGRPGRYELMDGVAVMHAGATRAHERISKRVFSLLFAQCDEAKFDVNKGDFGVRIAAGRGRGTILYPDVVVDTPSADPRERATETPIVVIEVLSESTDFDYHVAKFARYAGRSTMRRYIVFSQHEARAWVWTRETEGAWSSAPEEIGATGLIALPEIGAKLAMPNIYR